MYVVYSIIGGSNRQGGILGRDKYCQDIEEFFNFYTLILTIKKTLTDLLASLAFMLFA